MSNNNQYYCRKTIYRFTESWIEYAPEFVLWDTSCDITM